MLDNLLKAMKLYRQKEDEQWAELLVFENKFLFLLKQLEFYGCTVEEKEANGLLVEFMQHISHLQRDYEQERPPVLRLWDHPRFSVAMDRFEKAVNQAKIGCTLKEAEIVDEVSEKAEQLRKQDEQIKVLQEDLRVSEENLLVQKQLLEKQTRIAELLEQLQQNPSSSELRESLSALL